MIAMFKKDGEILMSWSSYLIYVYKFGINIYADNFTMNELCHLILYIILFILNINLVLNRRLIKGDGPNGWVGGNKACCPNNKLILKELILLGLFPNMKHNVSNAFY